VISFHLFLRNLLYLVCVARDISCFLGLNLWIQINWTSSDLIFLPLFHASVHLCVGILLIQFVAYGLTFFIRL